MIVVPLYDGQGLGNQLWVYAAGRSIAEETGRAFRLVDAEKFKASSFLSIDAAAPAPDAPEVAPIPTDIRTYSERLFYDEELNYVASGFDDLPTAIPGPLRLEGLFQDERYFFGKPERLSSYIRPHPDLLDAHPVAKDTCVINLRGGEYKNHRALILPKTYWEQAQRYMRNTFGIDRFIVVTDDRAYADLLFPGLPVVAGDVGTCFATVYNAPFRILSNSSFGYFPVKLAPREAGRVVAPLYWARPFNRLKRWASPANLYRDWLFMDENGATRSFEDCVAERDATEAFYRAHYNALCNSGKLVRRGWRRIVPAPVARLGKRVLSRVMPARFG